APLHLLPTLWYKNDWSWFPQNAKPHIAIEKSGRGGLVLKATHRTLEPFWLHCDAAERVLFTENETNQERLFGVPSASPYVKDAFDRYVVHGEEGAVNPERVGTKAAPYHVRDVAPGESVVLRLRLTHSERVHSPLGVKFDATFDARKAEADAF